MSEVAFGLSFGDARQHLPCWSTGARLPEQRELGLAHLIISVPTEITKYSVRTSSLRRALDVGGDKSLSFAVAWVILRVASIDDTRGRVRDHDLT